LQARIEYCKKKQCDDPDLYLYLEDMTMKQEQVTSTDTMIAKWESKIHELGEKDYASSVPAMANLNDRGALIALANMAIVEDISLENGDDDKDVGDDSEFNFGEAPSNDHINSVVNDIHGNQD
jgi:hypothetical protein